MVAKTKITGSAGDRSSVVQKLSSLSSSASDTNVCVLWTEKCNILKGLGIRLNLTGPRTLIWSRNALRVWDGKNPEIVAFQRNEILTFAEPSINWLTSDFLPPNPWFFLYLPCTCGKNLQQRHHLCRQQWR